MKTFNVDGKDKEIEFVAVSKKDGELRIFFTDKTYKRFTDVNILVEDDAE